MLIFITRDGEKPKELKIDALQRRFKNEKDREILKTLLGTKTRFGNHAEIRGFIGQSGDGIEFVVRTKTTNRANPDEVKFGEPMGKTFISFEDLQIDFKLDASTKANRDRFRDALTKKVMEPLRQQLSEAEKTVRRLRPLFPPKADAKAEEAKGTELPLRFKSLNGKHPEGVQASTT